MRFLPHLATAADIVQWSDRIDSRSELPRLIRTLIRYNNDQVVRLDMRSGEGVGVEGYDGIVQASKATPLVPEGVSVWEMGTGNDPGAKANKDYRKRTLNPQGVDPGQTTFVFLTSRRWPEKKAWEDAKRAKGEWLDVRAFDVDDIELGLEAAPSAHIQFSEAVGKPAAEVQSLEDWWAGFSALSSPPLTPSLVLSGRGEGASELVRLLDEDKRVTTLRARSTDDVLAFVACALQSAPEDVRESLMARALVVRDAATLRRLDAGSGLLMLLQFDEAMRREAELVQSNHVVFLSVNAGPVDIDLPPIDFKMSVQALREQGLSEEQAEPLARAAHKGLSAYLRLAAVGGRAPVLEWSAQMESLPVRRAWLAGAWHTNRSGDVQVLSELLGSDYGQNEPELLSITQTADPFLTMIGGAWAVVSPEDSWQYCQANLTSFDLQALESAVQTVLGAVDPALELEPDQRWMAAVYGKSRIHSSSLRHGIATTLCLLGCNGDSVSLGGGRSGRTWAEGIVARLTDRANTDTSADLWTSLADVLPLLAEAAPDVFLRAVQTGVSGAAPTLLRLFIDQGGDTLTVSSPHTGLLWALELLAWSSDHFALAVDALAVLVELDPGGRLSNRPAGSLHDIFRPWLPQTSAGPESRLAALDGIVARHAQVGRTLLLELLPQHSEMGTYTYAPRFREWRPEKMGVLMSEHWQFVSAVGERLLKMAETDPTLWVELVPRLADMPPDLRDAAFAALEVLEVESLPRGIRTEMWSKLNELVGRHQEFADADWAMPQQALDELSTIRDRFEPSDPVERFRRLFSSYAPDIGVGKHRNFAAYELELASLRAEAAAQIAREQGLDALLTLASTLDMPGLLGVAASADPELDPEVVVDLLDSDADHEVAFATGFVRRTSKGATAWLLPWADSREGRPLLQARLLLCSDELVVAWEVALRLGQAVDDAYWNEFSGYGRGSDFELVNDVARNMITHGRAAAALDCLCVYSHQKSDEIDTSLIVKGFEALLAGNDREVGLLSSYDISRLLELLRGSAIDEDQLALLEWRLLPASDAGVGPTSPILEKKLSRDPAFFVEMVSLCYKPHSSDSDRETPRHIVQNAYRLLEQWSHVPGSDEPAGVVDHARLDAWVEEARRLLKDADRAEIGDHLIGKILAHSPEDPDGTWPTRAVRDLIETSASAKLESGFRAERFNMRGVTSRGLTEGGAQEYALSRSYSDWAEKIQDSWPRTAAVLRTLASGYADEGKMHDEEAERVEEGLDLRD